LRAALVFLRRYGFTALVLALTAFAIVYAAAKELGVLHVLRTADVGWQTSPSWDVPLMLWGVLLNTAAVLFELMPYFMLGVLLGGLLSEFVSRSAIERHMGAGGPKSITVATVAGCAVPICSCGIVPVLAGLVQAGLPLAPVIAFLVAAPMLNPATLAMTVGLLGWQVAVARAVAVFVIAMVMGLLVKHLSSKGWLRNPVKLYVPPRLTGEQQALFSEVAIHLANHPQGLPAERLSEVLGREVKAEVESLAGLGLLEPSGGAWTLAERDLTDPGNAQACFVLAEEGEKQGSFRRRLGRALTYSLASFAGLARYILLAGVIAGTIKVLLPAEVVAGWLGGSTVDSVVLAALVAVPMYVCTCSDVPMVNAFVEKGMGGGAALAFLLGGPGLSIPSLVMLSGVFKKRLLLVYAAVSLVGCIVAGAIYNIVMT
jgi:uncharacterized membrane protein YraQ (UPF0718 family)